MRIGELSRRTGISTRMLRYYEEQGLLTSERSTNGYRSYAEGDVERAATIGSLIQSGLTTRLVGIVLSQDSPETSWTPACDRIFADILTEELQALEDKLACLTRSRDAVRSYLAAAPGLSPR